MIVVLPAMRFRSFVCVAVLLEALHAVMSIAPPNPHQHHQDHDCALWIAPSYTGTSKEPKYGIFAGRPYRINETLPLAELAIPLVDFMESYNRNNPSQDAILDFVESNMWTSEFVGSAWEGNHSAPVVIPGIGVLPQYHSGISNVDFFQEGVLQRTRPKSPKAGTPHPSRGAISTYFNVTLKATTAIPAGMELFADFGDVWDGNYTNDFYQDRFYRQDYWYADQIIAELVAFYRGLEDTPLGLQEDILDFLLDKVLGTAAGKHAKTIKSLIPENPRKLQRVLDAGGSFLYRYSDMIRTKEWLSKNGYCLDTLREGRSEIPYAGRGAFATRRFERGQLISLTPMMHIADKNLMTMYPVKAYRERTTGRRILEYDREAGPIGKQLFINYCFGHPESSLLLFPLGSQVTLINHAKSPNAYITWARLSDNGLSNQHKYQDYTVRQLAGVDKIVIVMKIVALRDIEDGEEVTIDYGENWEATWEDYMDVWEKTRGRTSHPLLADDVRDHYVDKPLQTIHTLPEHPYPPNVAPACFLHTRERPDGVPRQDGSLRIREWFEPESPGDLFLGSRLQVVDIMERVETGDHFFYNYTVMARASDRDFQKVVTVPHKACTFVSRPYTSDLTLAGAFRHPIEITDDQFPQAWRDLR